MDNSADQVIKTEGNEEILFYYVDDNGGNQEGVVTKYEYIDQIPDTSIQQTIYIEHDPENPQQEYILSDIQESDANQEWGSEEWRRLLVFYIDNKDTFLSGATKKIFLWNIVCKTMLIGQSPDNCDAQLGVLKQKYLEEIVQQSIHKDYATEWELFELANQAFHDDEEIKLSLQNISIQEVSMEQQPEVVAEHQVQIPQLPPKVKRSIVDDKVVQMLNIYLKHKQKLKNLSKDYWQKGLWETIAIDMGEDDAEYWHKRFLNFKHAYIRLLERRVQNPNKISWPYMELFDQIYQDDLEFQKKYGVVHPKQDTIEEEVVPKLNTWNSIETLFLCKYYFDSFSEFVDRSIPNSFLWEEVAKLLDKRPVDCKEKYMQMKTEHIDKYVTETYNITDRPPTEIILDHIIAKEVRIKFANMAKFCATDEWETTEIDILAKFFIENLQLFKDITGHFVCFEAVAKKLNKTVFTCKRKWDELVILYKTIVKDKRQDPEMQVDWRYIEVFDKIYDDGLNENLLKGYENLPQDDQEDDGKSKMNGTSLKKEPNDSSAEDFAAFDDDSKDDDYDGTPGKKRKTAAKATQLLEYYLKNKEKFAKSRKNTLWEVVGRKIGMSGDQCAHRFRNLKQVYTTYVEREVNRPDKPITWPHYQLCKKVFGYRSVKSDVKSKRAEDKEWSADDIKQLIDHFSHNFEAVNSKATDLNAWADLSDVVNKSKAACRDKFMELRKSYRKLKTMKQNNSSVNVTWVYFNVMDEIFNAQESKDEPMEVYDWSVNEDAKEMNENDDVQCIIVIPEGQDLGDLSNAKIITKREVKPTVTWTRLTKKRLLINYLKYAKSKKGQVIEPQEMWKEISERVDRSPVMCRRMYIKLKNRYLKTEDEAKKATPYYILIQKIAKSKPKLKKQVKHEDAQKVYKDVVMSDEKVIKALEYYIQHIEEFASPRFEKRYVWAEMAKATGESVSKVFNKINYLKHNDNHNYVEVFKEIASKETGVVEKSTKDSVALIENEEESGVWSETEIEQLLIWYLANLSKFKNPKYVRKYLWLDASKILQKSALSCSKKMADIRTEYRDMVKENSPLLNVWKYQDLCQKIYGTGKQKSQ